MFIPSSNKNYERPPGHLPGYPSIFIHNSVTDHFGMPQVNYESQRDLHRIDIPGSPDEMPAVYINSMPYKQPKLHVDVEPSAKLSRESQLKGNRIDVNLRTFFHAGQETVTGASSVRLSREIILQSAARADLSQRSFILAFIKPMDFKDEFAFPLITGFVAEPVINLFSSTETALLAAGGLSSLLALPNIFELREKRNQRIRDAAKPIVERLIVTHRNDFSFPPRP